MHPASGRSRIESDYQGLFAFLYAATIQDECELHSGAWLGAKFAETDFV